MKRIRRILSAVPLLLLACSLHAAKPYDVLDLPAVQSPLAAHALIYSLTRAGERFFATGIRGHILYSDDFGQSWTQAESVPVRASLLDASFPTPDQGWVVGHEAVILHTEDGGKTWVKQADGRALPKIGLDYYQKKLAAHPDDERYAFLIDEMNLAVEQEADRPFFKIFMRDITTGFAAGAYGYLFRTVDAGKSWYPIMELLDLEQMVHLFDLAQQPNAPANAFDRDTVAADIVVSGEMGTILAMDPETAHWRMQDFPYEGSMFTISATGGDSLVTGGLRGLAFYSTDRGASWTAVKKPPTGAVVSSTVLADGRVILATQEGNLLASSDHGASFTPLPMKDALPLSDVIEGRPGELILSGVFGVRIYKLPE